MPDRCGHRLADRARSRHCAPIQSRVGRREKNKRPQTTHRRGCQRPAARRRGHRRVHPGPRRRAPATRRTTCRVLHHTAGLGRRRLPRSLLLWAEHVLACAFRSSNANQAVPDFMSARTSGWSSGPSRGSASTVAASATTKPDPITTKRCPHRHDRPQDPPTRPNVTGSQTRSNRAIHRSTGVARSDVSRVFRSSFVLLQVLMHPREVHDAPSLSA